MDVTQLALTWVGWSNGEKLASTLVEISLRSSSGAKNYRAMNGVSKRGGRGRKEGNACRQTPGF